MKNLKNILVMGLLLTTASVKSMDYVHGAASLLSAYCYMQKITLCYYGCDTINYLSKKWAYGDEISSQALFTDKLNTMKQSIEETDKLIQDHPIIIDAMENIVNAPEEIAHNIGVLVAAVPHRQHHSSL